jgi:hypothetical protein
MEKWQFFPPLGLKLRPLGRHILHILWDPTVYYPVHKKLTLTHIMSQLNRVKRPLVHFFNIRFNFIHYQRLRLLSDPLHLGHPHHDLFAFSSLPCHLVSFFLTATFVHDYKLRSLLLLLVTSSFLGSNALWCQTSYVYTPSFILGAKSTSIKSYRGNYCFIRF